MEDATAPTIVFLAIVFSSTMGEEVVLTPNKFPNTYRTKTKVIMTTKIQLINWFKNFGKFQSLAAYWQSFGRRSIDDVSSLKGKNGFSFP